MKRILLVIPIFIFTISIGMTASAELPRIAVYVTGDVPENEKTALGTRMLASLVNSGKYRGIERSSAFLAEIEREQIHQRSGAIDDAQISELGKQFGVKYVCIAAITPALGAFQVSARIVNVETAEVMFIGEGSTTLATLDDLQRVSDEVVIKMFGEHALPRISAAPQSVAGQLPKEKKTKSPALLTIRWSGAAFAAVGLVGGLAYHAKGDDAYNTYLNSKSYADAENSKKRVEDAASMRDLFYILGAVGLSGFTVTLFF